MGGAFQAIIVPLSEALTFHTTLFIIDWLGGSKVKMELNCQWLIYSVIASCVGIELTY